MKFRGIILLLGSMVIGGSALCPEFELDDLPSAPSAVQQERTQPKPPAACPRRPERAGASTMRRPIPSQCSG